VAVTPSAEAALILNSVASILMVKGPEESASLMVRPDRSSVPGMSSVRVMTEGMPLTVGAVLTGATSISTVPIS